jgi:Flp pilus assembly protein TadB
MDDKYRQQQELSEREQQLQARELDLRLRELEVEVNRQDAYFPDTIRDRTRKNPVQRPSNKDLSTAAKLSGAFIAGAFIISWARFMGFFLAGFVIVFVTPLLAWMSLFAFLGVANWLWFKSRDSSK